MSQEPTDEKTGSVHDLIKAIDANLMARGQEEHDAALAAFMKALDYYIERSNQAWVR